MFQVPTPGVAGHPRACGENRGWPLRCRATERAIPARAGRTGVKLHQPLQLGGPSPRVRGEPGLAARQWLGWPGHPRACGENFKNALRSARRGRAIPARAGRTDGAQNRSGGHYGPSPRVRGEPGTEPRPPRIFTGHPRACGENVRADHRPCRCLVGHPRACGENARRWCWSSCPRTGHPRACGENHRSRSVELGWPRAIPARAVSTDIENCTTSDTEK